MVLEMVPSEVAAQVTEELSIPTISVGAGPKCDGQLMVWSDWAGFTRGRIPRFVKQYAQIGDTLFEAARAHAAAAEREEAGLADLQAVALLALRQRQSPAMTRFLEEQAEEDDALLNALNDT